MGPAMLNRLTDMLNFQTEALALRSERQRLLASNIANADTPGYQARDFDFARALKEATAAQQTTGAVSGNSAAPFKPLFSARHELQQQYSLPAQTNLDSNTVDMDRERANFADNAVKYEATLRFINGSVRTALDAMKSHNAS